MKNTIKSFTSRLAGVVVAGLSTVSMKCSDVFSEINTATSNLQDKIDGLVNAVFPLMIGIIFLSLILTRDQKKIQVEKVIGICCVLGFVGWKLAYNGVIVNTIKTIFNV